MGAIKKVTAMLPETVSTSDLAMLLGVSDRQVLMWANEGLVVRVSPGSFDLALSVSTYCKHVREVAAGRGGEEEGKSLATERARLAKGQADAMELKNGITRGELIRADDAERTWAGFLKELSSRIRAVPSRIRQQIPAMTVAEVQIIDAEIRAALDEMGRDASK